MRFMMLLKADKSSEAGLLPSPEILADMGKFNEEMIKAGVMLDGAGLKPSSKGARVTFPGGAPQVTDGPFAETKELIAGYWMIKVASKDEAIAWAKKVPVSGLLANGRVAEIELRPLYELEDFADVPPQVAEQERSFTPRRG